ncbi:fimbrial protein [Psychromonas aquimarina]|uniref:fimbrial protein n=1 Tax=Psychromonas aquimarina TaxID=444919 RepID=UPI0004165994|nr:fimbrial protein [Psychromonas aquimarina]
MTSVLLFLLILINFVLLPDVVAADCSWEKNINFSHKLTPSDLVKRVDGTMQLNCGSDDVIFSLSVPWQQADNGAFITNIPGVTVRYRVNGVDINGNEQQLASGQIHPLEVILEQKVGNKEGGVIQFPPLKICYTQPGGTNRQCEVSEFISTMTLEKLSCDLPSVIEVALGTVRSNELPSIPVRFNLPKMTCIAQNVKTISFSAPHENNIILLTPGSEASGIGIEIFSGGKTITLDQNYPAHELATSAGLVARVVSLGSPSAGQFNAIVNIHLTYF